MMNDHWLTDFWSTDQVWIVLVKVLAIGVQKIVEWIVEWNDLDGINSLI